MDLGSVGLGTIALALGAIVLGLLFALWLYRAREVPVDGSAPMVAARAAAIALVVLLLINPRIPGGAVTSGSSAWTLVDRSLSMAAQLDGGGTPWEQATSQAGDGPVVFFGSSAARGDLAVATPDDAASRLLSGLRLAVEAGARDVRVISDFRVSDLDAAFDLLERSGVGADFQPVGGQVKNVGVSDFVVGANLGETSTFTASVEVFGEAAQGDSVQLEVNVEGRTVATETVAVPAPGSRLRVELPLPSAPADGRVSRYSVMASLPGDGFPDDDERVRYVQSGVDDGGVVLISSAPDWEPRFLLPTLRDVTGFEGEGYLAIEGGQYLRSFADDGSVSTVDSATVRRRAARAEVVVVHSAGSLDAWTLSWLPRLGRVILLAPDPAAAAALGVTAAPGRTGEWYVEDDAPASPISGGLAGASFEGLPPLGPILSTEGAPGWSSALRAAQPQGPPTPAMLLGGGRRRIAVATAQGWWRWAFREGAPRETYRRVWSAVAGWMMEGQALAAGDRVEPVDLVVERGAQVEWAAPGRVGDSVRVRIGPADAWLMDTTFVIDSTEAFRTASIAPGTYPYSVTSASDSASGRFDVQRYAPEMTLQMANVEEAVERAGPSTAMRVSGGRRLRTAGLPYLLLIAILSTEWLLRRRKGLR